MTRFIDKTGYTLVISMTDRNTNTDFENEFFEVGGLKQDDIGRYVVDDIDYLADYAKDCWACTGDFADGGEGNTFDLIYHIVDDNGIIYNVFYSDKMAKIAEECDVPYSAVI